MKSRRKYFWVNALQLKWGGPFSAFTRRADAVSDAVRIVVTLARVKRRKGR